MQNLPFVMKHCNCPFSWQRNRQQVCRRSIQSQRKQISLEEVNAEKAKLKHNKGFSPEGKLLTKTVTPYRGQHSLMKADCVKRKKLPTIKVGNIGNGIGNGFCRYSLLLNIIGEFTVQCFLHSKHTLFTFQAYTFYIPSIHKRSLLVHKFQKHHTKRYIAPM